MSVGVSAGAAKISTIVVDDHLDMGAYDLKTDDVKESTSTHGVDVDGVLIKDDAINSIDAVGGSVLPKDASDNLRNSHDAEDTMDTNDASYHLVKTMTFTYGIKGTLRAKMEFHSNNGSYTVYCAFYKNQVLIGTPASTVETSYPAAVSEDIDFGTVAAGETIELYAKAQAAGAICTFKNMRLYYDNLGGAAVVTNS